MKKYTEDRIPELLCENCMGVMKPLYYSDNYYDPEIKSFHYNHICKAYFTIEQLDKMEKLEEEKKSK